MKSLSVLLADDHTLFRAGLRGLVGELPGISVIAEAANGREAVQLACDHRPDLVVMDISMKELNGIEAAKQLRSQAPAIKIIILSMHESEDLIAQALSVGARGYLLKDSAEPELALAINTVMRGEIYLSPRVSRRLVESYLQQMSSSRSPLDVLTPRQREILQMIAEGHSTKEVAFRLNVSIKTVESHRAQIMQRLDIHDVPGLVRYALRNGLIQNN